MGRYSFISIHLIIQTKLLWFFYFFQYQKHYFSHKKDLKGMDLENLRISRIYRIYKYRYVCFGNCDWYNAFNCTIIDQLGWWCECFIYSIVCVIFIWKYQTLDKGAWRDSTLENDCRFASARKSIAFAQCCNNHIIVYAFFRIRLLIILWKDFVKENCINYYDCKKTLGF